MKHKSQMDTVELYSNENLGNDTYMEHSLPPVDSMECDPFGEQEVFPRIGEDYQAEIPELVEKSDYLSQENDPAKAQSSSLKFIVGLPIPVILVYEDNGNRNQQIAGHLDQMQFQSNVGEPDALLNLQITSAENPRLENNGFVSGEQHEGSGGLLVPYSASECWSDVENASFLLGLYIFGKNLIQLKKFLESKRMEDIQLYYYGKFYQTQEYLRWSDCRKMRGRKCVVGEKLFTGVRLQELLSRILPVISDECKNRVLEVSMLFGEGKTTFEDFVFSLKSLVGMNILVESVGIGKGKQDITCILETSKSNQGNTTRAEIPVGKAFSSLTCSEIVKYLTGDYRLRKARSNDLFWEAVWPRLLARGWHSEQPRDQAYVASSKNALVFLVPGIKKFSRGKLERGNHYFDSVTDVLNKVASDPGLIELENEENESKKIELGYEQNNEVSEEDDLTTQRRHCYLQPRTLNGGAGDMRFTVVDTSLGDGRPYKIMELRCLSVDIFNSFKSRSSIEISYQDGPDASTDESEPDDSKLLSKGENYSAKAKASPKFPNGEVHYDVKNLEMSNTKHKKHNAYPNLESISANDNTNRKRNSEDKKPRRVKKNRLGHGMKEDDAGNVAPKIKRRRRLTACIRGETSNVRTDNSTEPAIVSLQVRSNVMTNPSGIPPNLEPEMTSIPSSAVSYHEKLSVEGSSKSSLANSVGYASVGNHHANVELPEVSHVHNMIDLNLPPDFDSAVSVTGETREHEASSTSQEVIHSEQQSDLNNPQRRSTRNRPPTTRALEALASGFLTVSSRRTGREGRSRVKSTSRASRHAQIAGIHTSDNYVAPIVQESPTGESSDSNKSEIREFQVLTEENMTPFSGP